MQFTDPNKRYFTNELALKKLFGPVAFNDLKKLMDPCCGIGVDKICVEPCGGTSMCPRITITAVNLNCITGDCFATIVVTDSGGAPVTGFFQLQFLVPIPLPLPLNFAFQIDTFSVSGDGTFTIPLPNTCLLLNELDLGTDLFSNITAFFAYQVSGPASNIFPSSQAFVNCPKMTMCVENLDAGKSCPNTLCVDGTIFIEFNLTPTDGITNPITLQYCTDPNTGSTPTWVTFGSVTVTSGGGLQTFNVDASTLPTGTCDISIQAIDANGVSTMSQADIDDSNMDTFCVVAPCTPVGTITNFTISKPICNLGAYTAIVQFDYSLSGDYVVEIDFGGSGVYTVVDSLPGLIGPGTYGPTVDALSLGLPILGIFPVRVREVNSGTINTPDTNLITISACI